MRKPRKYEQTCTCKAYKFPHRFGGGKCTGKVIVYEYFSETGGIDGECASCMLCDKSQGFTVCEVIDGGEPAEGCQAWRDYVRWHGIRIYKKAA